MVSILRKTKRGKRTSKYVLTLICIWGLSLLNLKLTDQAPVSIESAEEHMVKLQKEKYLLYWSHSGFSNQLIALENAAHLAYATKRTLVLPPVLPHHTFKQRLKYEKYKAVRGARHCDKERRLYNFTKLANEFHEFPSYEALFNFDSVTKETNGLQVIDMQRFSRLKDVYFTNFSNWCVDIYNEKSCMYVKTSSLFFDIANTIKNKCSEIQIAAIGSAYLIRPTNAIRKWSFNQLKMSTAMLILLNAIYKKLPENYTGVHIRIHDSAKCKPQKTCEEKCNEERMKNAFLDLMKDIDFLHNTPHVLLGYGNEVVKNCFQYFAKGKYVATTVYDIVENDEELLYMLESIGSEKETIYLLLDQILIAIAENVRMKFAENPDNPQIKASTYQRRIKTLHNRRYEILAQINSIHQFQENS